MRLVRWQPSGAVRRVPTNDGLSIVREWDRAMNEIFNWAPASRTAAECCQWVPRVDVHEEGEQFVVDFDLPGMRKEDITIEVENDVLTVSGERKTGERDEQDQVRRRERFHGKFSRSMSFPTDVDPEKIQASFQDGVLTVSIAKAEQVKPRKIEIQ